MENLWFIDAPFFCYQLIQRVVLHKPCDVTVIMVRNEPRVQILDDAICISHRIGFIPLGKVSIELFNSQLWVNNLGITTCLGKGKL